MSSLNICPRISWEIRVKVRAEVFNDDFFSNIFFRLWDSILILLWGHSQWLNCTWLSRLNSTQFADWLPYILRSGWNFLTNLAEIGVLLLGWQDPGEGELDDVLLLLQHALQCRVLLLLIRQPLLRQQRTNSSRVWDACWPIGASVKVMVIQEL